MPLKKKRSRIWILIVVFVALGCLAFFCLKALTHTTVAIDPERLARVERIDLVRSVGATGKIQPTTIVSPMDGVVLYRYSEIGDAVSSILTMGSGANIIMTLGDLREVYVKGKVDESDVGKVYLGQTARIKVESFKDQVFTGKVTKISPLGVEADNVTTFEVRVSISNDSHKLMATMTANAEIMIEERKGVLAIPEGAIIYKKDHSCEAEVPDATAGSGKKRVPIVTGISNGSKMQILKGLSEGQQVILQQ